jgi:PKHD-type hydroxylase
MLLRIPNVLTQEQVAECRRVLDSANWTDGKVTAGAQSAKAKDNMQLPEDSAEARRLGDMILTALGRNPLFISAALPIRVFPPLFNRYQGGQAFGVHIDNAIRPVKGTQVRVRTDISSTLFLNPPEEYDGGELVIEDTFGTHPVKLPAGDMIIYPGTSLHRVQPITRGARLASFFWSQSMVRDDGRRRLLFELDTAIQHLTRDHPDHPSLVSLANTYHNLLRQWAEI